MKPPKLRILRPSFRKRYADTATALRNVESTLTALGAWELEPLLPEGHAWNRYFQERELLRSKLSSFLEFQTEVVRVRCTETMLFVGKKIIIRQMDRQPSDYALRLHIWSQLREAFGLRHNQTMTAAEKCLRYYRSLYKAPRKVVRPPDRSADVLFLALEKVKKHRKVKSKWVITPTGPQYVTKEVKK